jgi:hypothetical protein
MYAIGCYGLNITKSNNVYTMIYTFIKYSIALLIVLAACGCEGYRTSTGIVRDRATNLPMDSVFCVVTTGTERKVTGEDGFFSVQNDVDNCFKKCQDLNIEFSKNGYKKSYATNPGKDVVIYMER